MISESSIIFKRFLKISEKLKLKCHREYSFKIEKNKFNKNRVIFILTNNRDNNRDNNIIYNNLKYIKRELNLKVLPKIKKNSFVHEFIYGFDFDENIYKIYITTIEVKNDIELEVIYGLEFINNKIIPRVYFEKNIKNDLSKDYVFLKKYKKYVNYKNFDRYYKRIKNNKVDSIHLKYNIKLNVYMLKKYFIKMCNDLGWGKKKLLDFFEEIRDEKYYVNIIGFSKDNINLYFNKI